MKFGTMDYTIFFISAVLIQFSRLAESWSPVGFPLRRMNGSTSTMTRMSSSDSADSSTSKKGKLLVLGGTGFLGQAVCKRAIMEGYEVTSLSRRGLPPLKSDADSISTLDKVDYRQGDARSPESLINILSVGGFSGVIHCVGLLFDSESGLGDLNKYASGSGSLLDSKSTYDAITRQTAFNAIDASIDYAIDNGMKKPLPFCFTSAAEVGWPDVPGGQFMQKIAPDFLKQYLAAKRVVESKLMDSKPTLRPIIVRPSLIYSMDRPASYLPVAGFFFFNRVGAPFVDRPVTVQSLAAAMVRSMGSEDVSGVLRYKEIERLSS
mmetsp:Transcript_20597/g.26544  ORF Transcript_20597/g.26544 Transcript_20597/m.26544 type:complete len:321 (+) Transcript_20597:70-1032(+)|eukprot:CAMPEP_0198144754 /NCGR_PEP_ID=MMETSP1443-20131203/18361_1 /TAXON_ID=186043 /ORGANISM="Entomoneis sp., Strain CCMP2396" /LENGTH=320 /DNA_ID=CAMNT_0043808213 /DNA_START=34 /DNA_END=996 /DNA_ORIENTATION=-